MIVGGNVAVYTLNCTEHTCSKKQNLYIIMIPMPIFPIKARADFYRTLHLVRRINMSKMVKNIENS